MAKNSDRSAIIIAFHFPPVQGSSGVLRTISLIEQLLESDWEVHVVTAIRSAYFDQADSNLELIPPGTRVHRSLALNTPKHLSIKNKHLGFLCIPDNWATWIPFAFLRAAYLAVLQKPSFVFTTYPIASCHVIGWLLKRIFNVCWIADLRDPMLQNRYPRTRPLRAAYGFIERRIARYADLVTVSAPGTRRMMVQRYGADIEEKLALIENGVDTERFIRASRDLPVTSDRPFVRKVLLHSGVVYPVERNPTSLFKALSSMKKSGDLSAANFELRLRGCQHEDFISDLATAADIGDLVSILPPLSYQEAAQEILQADGLLVLQASNCNDQIPAKIYEYLCAGKPILALTDLAGDTGSTLYAEGIGAIAALEDEGAVHHALVAFVRNELSSPEQRRSSPAMIQSSRFSRKRRAAQFEAEILRVISGRRYIAREL